MLTPSHATDRAVAVAAAAMVKGPADIAVAGAAVAVTDPTVVVAVAIVDYV